MLRVGIRLVDGSFYLMYNQYWVKPEVSQALRSPYKRKWTLGRSPRNYKTEKRIVSDFVLDKRLCKICLFTRHNRKSPWGLSDKWYSSNRFFSCVAYCYPRLKTVEMISRCLITKYQILKQNMKISLLPRNDIQGHSSVIGEHLAAFLSQNGQIICVTCDNLIGGWRFEIKPPSPSPNDWL